MSVRFSLHGMLRLIRVDALCRVHNVGFLAGRFISVVNGKRVLPTEKSHFFLIVLRVQTLLISVINLGNLEIHITITMGDLKIKVKDNLLYFVVVLFVLIWTNSVHSSVSSEDGRYLLKTSKELTDDEKSEYAANGFVFLHQVIFNKHSCF